MPEQFEQQTPEILRAIQSAERKVENMIRAAEQEAAATLGKARAQAETLLAEQRRSLEQKQADALTKGFAEAEREAERLITDAEAKAGDLKTWCMGRVDDAAELVLRRVLPAFHMTED
ncbi:MAG: hypothetical protein AMXMBFR67_23570 [Nitrospira sp.]